MDNKGFLLGALVGAVSHYAYENQKKKHLLKDTYAAKAKNLASQVVHAAKHIGDTKPVSEKQFIYGACSLLGAAMGLLLTIKKNGKSHKKMRILSNNHSHAVSANHHRNSHRKHVTATTAGHRKTATARSKRH